VYKLCLPVSVETSQRIWNRDGAPGKSKNESLTPRFHQCDECAQTPAFPKEFQRVVPAKKGDLFHEARPPVNPYNSGYVP